MKKRCRRNCAFAFWMAVALVLLSAARLQAQHKLLAHGGQADEWVAQVVPPPAATDPSARQTRIWNRRVMNGVWSELETIDGHVVSLANVGPELAALDDAGDWQICSPLIGNRTGPPALTGARLIAFAADGDTLWALAQATPTASASAIRASTLVQTQSAELPEATTAPAAVWELLKLDKGYWAAQLPTLDPAFSAHAQNPSLAVVGGQIFVAAQVDTQLEVLSIRATHARPTTQGAASSAKNMDEAAWKTAARIPLGSGASWKLLGVNPAPYLWLAPDAQGWGYLLSGEAFENRVDLKKTGTAGVLDDKAVMCGGNRLRLALLNKDGKIFEQVYDGIPGPTFAQPVGSLSEISLPPAPRPNLWPWLIGSSAMLGAALALAWTNRSMRGAPAVKIELDDDTGDIGSGQRTILAPLSLRLAAGLLDAAPLLLAFMLAGDESSFNAEPTWADLTNSHLLLPVLIGTVAYLLHTMLAELICGASLGKLVFGLRVVDRQGASPAGWRLALRNLLRIPDCLVIPLAFAAFTPLRQRLGDQAAGTIVVLNPAMHTNIPETHSPD